MNVFPSSYPFDMSEHPFGRTLLFVKRNSTVPESETLRCMGESKIRQRKSEQPDSCKPSLRRHSSRPTPYEKPVKITERKPIVIKKTTTTTIEIDKERDWKDHQLVEKLLPYINGGMEYIDEDGDDGDTELTTNTNVKIEIKDEDKKEEKKDEVKESI